MIVARELQQDPITALSNSHTKNHRQPRTCFVTVTMKSSLIILGKLRQRVTQTPATFSSVAIARRRSSTLAAATSTSCGWKDLPVPSNNRNEDKSRSPVSSPNGVAAKRSHYSYADGPGRFAFSDEAASERHSKRLQTWDERGFTVGIGGPVGSGKTALVLALIKRLAAENAQDYPPLAVVTNDIFTQEDAQFLWKEQDVLPSKYIKAVETGGCPHAAIREDVSSNLTACEELTETLASEENSNSSIPPLILCESGGDNLAANFSSELADLTLYVIDVAGGDKVPRKGGPGITQSDLLVVNKIDLAEAVGADLGIMKRDADLMRSTSLDHDHGHDHSHDHSDDNDSASEHPESGPTVFTSVKNGTSLDEIEAFILEKYRKAMAPAK